MTLRKFIDIISPRFIIIEKERCSDRMIATTLCLGCVQSLGMTTGKIPDNAITASSKLSDKHAPMYARLYTLNRDGHYSTWCPKRNRIGEWIQVDLGTVVMVTKIATQGRTEYSGWTTRYSLRYSVKGTKFEQYKNNKVTKW